MFAHVSIGADTSMFFDTQCAMHKVMKCSHTYTALIFHMCNPKVQRQQASSFGYGFTCVIFDSVYLQHERILSTLTLGIILKWNDFVHTSDINKTKSSNAITTATDYFPPRKHTNKRTLAKRSVREIKIFPHSSSALFFNFLALKF